MMCKVGKVRVLRISGKSWRRFYENGFPFNLKNFLMLAKSELHYGGFFGNGDFIFVCAQMGA